MMKCLGDFLSQRELVELRFFLFTLGFSRNDFCLETCLSLRFVDFSGNEDLAIYLSQKCQKIRELGDPSLTPALPSTQLLL